VAARKSWCPDRRDMIWINCNPQAGREMKDVHPLVVLSPKEFNDRTGIVIGLPMTTASFNDTNPFAVKLKGPKAAASYILAHQPKSFDWRARGARPHPWKQVPEEHFAMACEALNQIIEIGR
jgi:mRNA interferase MazF